MQIKIVLTLVIAFLLVLFGIFNPGIIEISLFGFGWISTPIAFFVFVVFLAGAVYAGLMSIFDQIKQSMKIRQLKRKLKEVKEKREEQEEKEEDKAERKIEEITEGEVIEESTRVPRIV